jgi:hypothetical protein
LPAGAGSWELRCAENGQVLDDNRLVCHKGRLMKQAAKKGRLMKQAAKNKLN